MDVRPYLRLKAFARQKSNVIRYNDCAAHFGIKLGSTVIERTSDSSAKFHFCDGSIREVTVFEDSWPGGKSWKYVYVDVPPCALHNDFECQPRTVKLGQAWQIFVDLEKNPLHEPQSCRVIPSPCHPPREFSSIQNKKTAPVSFRVICEDGG